MQGWLEAFVLWTGISLGCMALLLTHTLTGGRWGDYIRRGAEAGMSGLALQLIMFVVLWAGAGQLYPWASHPDAWLNLPAFGVRGLAFFAFWLWAAWRLRRDGLRYEETGDKRVMARLQQWAGPVLFFYLLTASFAVVDWTMSLTPGWASTMFPFLSVTGQWVSATAFCAVLLAGRGTRLNRYDVGSFLLTFVILQAYCSYCEWILIWSGNMKDEIVFYTPRLVLGWQWIIGAVIVFQWALPFLLLIWGKFKEDPRSMRSIGAWMLVAEFCHVWWMVAPAHQAALRLTIWDVLLPLAMGAGWWLIVRYIYRSVPQELTHPYVWRPTDGPS
jgi:hypothetical protein